MNIDRLITISQDLGLLNETAQLQLIKERSSNDDCELILPLVGEFSAGKTTLINALLDSEKKLETGFKPTTATLFEVHFGAERNYAEIIHANGEKQEIQDLSTIKNEDLKDVLVVIVYDTSTKIPSNIILIDTPGLSSENHQHQQVLIDFLPYADAVLLLVDINTQMTRSLIDFISTMELAKKPVFLIITQCDTKTERAAEDTINKIRRECKLPLNQIVTVSSKKGNLQGFFDLIASIQHEKNSILAQANGQRIKNITNSIISHIDEMLSASISDSDLEQAIQEKESELQGINNKIDRMLSHSQMDVEDEKKRINKMFENTIFKRLDAIVSVNTTDYNTEALKAINNLASIVLNEFKFNVNKIIMNHCIRNNDTGIDLQSVQGVDLSQLNVDGLSYNLDLNVIGHEHDKHIAVGAKIVVAAAIVAAVVASAGTAAPAAAGAAGTAGTGAAAAGTGAAAAETAMATASAVDIVTDIANIASNAKTASRVEKAALFAQETRKQYGNVNEIDQKAGQKMGQKDKGLVEGLVGLATDKTWGKAKRQKAIQEYLDYTLMPQFKNAMEQNCQQVFNGIREMLQNASQATIAEKKIALQELMKQHDERREMFTQRLEKMRDYKNELLTR